MHNSSDDVRVFLAIPKIIVEHAFETNYRKMLLHLYLCRRERRAGVHLDIASACKSVRRRHCNVIPPGAVFTGTPLAAVTALVAALVAGALDPLAFLATTEIASMLPISAVTGI
jgi:hypothetical protein